MAMDVNQKQEKHVSAFAGEVPKKRSLGVLSLISGMLGIACLALMIPVNFWTCIGAFGFGFFGVHLSRLQQRRYRTNVALLGKILGLMVVGITLIVAVVYLLFVYLLIPFLF